ncbi:MAG: hypothetical protein JXB25_13080 [Deltaproteobacteria bacterium]|nr:hypothetical protein [Deltaproteobacteria bacterium]
MAITDSARAVVQKVGYESFGLPTPRDPAFRQPYAFTGWEWDRETGLYFYRARYYDPMERIWGSGESGVWLERLKKWRWGRK